MITNLQSFFEKHYQWLFGSLLVIVIISFVFAYGPMGRLSNSGKLFGDKADLFFGYNLADDAQVQSLAREASIGLWLKTGMPPYNPESLQTLVLERIIQEKLANSLAIPTPTAAQLGSYLGTLPPFQDEKGVFSRAKYEEFVGNFAKQQGLSKGYLSAQIAQRWRLDQVADRLEAGIYVLPTTVEREYALLHNQYSVKLATLKPSTDGLTVSADEAKAYYEAHKKNYHTAETRAGLLYSLPASKFTAQVAQPTEAQLEKYFEQVAMRFVQWQVTENGKTTGEAPKAPVYADHKEEVKKLFVEAKAARLAAEAVDAVVQKIYADKLTPATKQWEAAVKAAGLEVTEIPALAIDGKADKVPSEAVERLFTRALPDRAYSEAFVNEKLGGFILLTKVNVQESLALEKVTAQVNADALADKQTKAFKSQTEELLAKLKSVKDETTFDAVVAANKLTVTPVADFTLGKPAKEIGSVALLKGLAGAEANTAIGAADEDDQGVTVVFLKAKQLASFDAAKDESKGLKKRIEQSYARMSSLSYLNEYGAKNAKN